MRSFFGLVEQIAYTFHSSEVMSPFRNLLKPRNSEKGAIVWTSELDHAFNEAKKAMIVAMDEGVKIYDPKKPTAVSTDWSKRGIGQILSQKQCSCDSDQPGCCPGGWATIAFASRFCHPAEENYSPVEGEALSAAVGLHKFKHFVMGCDKLTLVVDHKPLVKLLGDKRMEDIPNSRLLRLKEKTLPFNFKVVHRPGLLHKGPDFASRYPQNEPDHFLGEMNELVENIEVALHGEVANSWENSGLSKVTWQMVKQATGSDKTLASLRELIEGGGESGRDDHGDSTHEERQFVPYMDRLWVQDGGVLLDDRVVIPEQLRKRVLDSLHSAHQGVSQMYARAELSVFWPGLHADLEEVRATCNICRVNAPSNPKLPPQDPPKLDYPFQQICADYMTLNGVQYLVVVDRLTGWPDVRRSKHDDSGAKGLVKLLRDLFSTYGISEELASHGRTEFTSYEV